MNDSPEHQREKSVALNKTVDKGAVAYSKSSAGKLKIFNVSFKNQY